MSGQISLYAGGGERQYYLYRYGWRLSPKASSDDHFWHTADLGKLINTSFAQLVRFETFTDLYYFLRLAFPVKFPILRHDYSTDMDKTKYVADLFIKEQSQPVINRVPVFPKQSNISG